jgi:hypothetical protein
MDATRNWCNTQPQHAVNSQHWLVSRFFWPYRTVDYRKFYYSFSLRGFHCSASSRLEDHSSPPLQFSLVLLYLFRSISETDSYRGTIVASKTEQNFRVYHVFIRPQYKAAYVCIRIRESYEYRYTYWPLTADRTATYNRSNLASLQSTVLQ